VVSSSVSFALGFVAGRIGAWACYTVADFISSHTGDGLSSSVLSATIAALVGGSLVGCGIVAGVIAASGATSLGVLLPILGSAAILRLVPQSVQRRAEQSSTDRPPRFAEYLLYFFMSPKDCESMCGDLEQEYTTLILPKFGHRAAQLWYWKQVAVSVGPIVWRFSLKVMRRAAIVSGLPAAWGILKHFL
jgi:hypothetical protein